MSEREQLARWMIDRSFSTGHGDTFGELLTELEWQVKELRERAALCPVCGHAVVQVYRGICLSMTDGSSDRACGCRAIGPDGKFYPDEVRA